ncbi:hypothetical protein BJ165DRAFT_1400467 [Panaeolus papilionaceus]|nr:hypothetical protein BJ165DRAFT_1400467 [Panaeolus papilionaceus]
MDLFGVGSGGCCAAIGVTGRCTLRTLSRLLVVLTLCCATARSQTSTSLYIPGFDPQPVSANVAGIGADGATTWILHQGSRDPTDTSSYADFIGTGPLTFYAAYYDLNPTRV